MRYVTYERLEETKFKIIKMKMLKNGVHKKEHDDEYECAFGRIYTKSENGILILNFDVVYDYKGATSEVGDQWIFRNFRIVSKNLKVFSKKTEDTILENLIRRIDFHEKFTLKAVKALKP